MTVLVRKTTQWLRWRIAYFLDKRFADICWSDLVSWAAYPCHYPFTDIFAYRNTAGKCEDYCYCGKCMRTGLCKHQCGDP